MPRYRFLGGPQRPDELGYLEPGRLYELDALPAFGSWEIVPGLGPAQRLSSSLGPAAPVVDEQEG